MNTDITTEDWILPDGTFLPGPNSPPVVSNTASNLPALPALPSITGGKSTVDSIGSQTFTIPDGLGGTTTTTDPNVANLAGVQAGGDGLGGTPSTGCEWYNPFCSSTGGTSVSDTIAQYFVRSVVIILGFIFIAAGLYMFKGNTVSINLLKELK